MIFVIGGSGSGKSAFAEERAAAQHRKMPAEAPLYYIATMRVFGADGRQKVERHRRMRAGKGFETVEQPADLAACVPALKRGGAALLECVSNLTANEMFPADGGMVPRDAVTEKVTGDILALDRHLGALVVVSNNIFEDGIQYGDSTMAYIRALGRINRNLAAAAEEVWEVTAGIAEKLK